MLNRRAFFLAGSGALAGLTLSPSVFAAVPASAAKEVTPTATECVLSAAGVELALRFTGAALPDDLDVLSAPITMVDFALRAVDGKAHECALTLSFSAALCAFGEEPRDMHAIS